MRNKVTVFLALMMGAASAMAGEAGTAAHEEK